MRTTNRLSWLFSIAILSVWSCAAALAVPYASGVRNTSGTTWEFVLNEAADSVNVTRNGGNVLNLGALAAGRHTFSMGGFSTFEIAVAKNTAAGFTEISQSSNLFTNFEQPTGLAVNRDPSTAFFGTLYVNNGRDLPTVSGRALGDGVYALTSDLQGVDLANNFAVVTDASDTTQAKAPGWNVGGARSSAFRMTLDDAGNVIVGDWDDVNGGIKYAAPNLSTGGLILDQEGGPTGGVMNGSGEFIHGSIVSKPYVTGSVGNNLVVYAMDEDLASIPFGTADGNNVWRWDVGSATNYDKPPTLIMDTGSMIDANSSTTDSDGDPWFINLNIGALGDIHRSERHAMWYLSEPRTNGHDSSALLAVRIAVSGDYNQNGVVDTADYVVWRNAGPTDTLPNDPTPGTVDGTDYTNWKANFGNTIGTPTIAWSSKQFSIDHQLDGFIGAACDPSLCGGIEDIFRGAYAVDLSNDGTKMYVMMNNLHDGVDDTNPYIGPASPNLSGHVLVIPLDANGLPNIQVDDNGTPGDPTDDFLSNVQSIDIGASGFLDRANLDVDVAGNIYVSNNISELLQVFSPGGNTVARTTSAGTFSLQTIPGAASGAVVPEPGALLLATCGLLAAAALSARRRKNC